MAQAWLETIGGSDSGSVKDCQGKGETMTRDDIIRMAKEASFHCGPNEVYVGGYNSTEDLERFANLVAAAEREACAKVCEEMVIEGDTYGMLYAQVCAESIKARGNK
jgi:hypothetical protein